MVSHIADIGLEVENFEAFKALLPAFGRSSITVGNYSIAQSKSGASLWFFKDPVTKQQGFAPHFDGESKINVRMNQEVSDEIKGKLEAVLGVWCIDAQTKEESTPIFFDCVNVANLKADKKTDFNLQLTAFPEKISSFRSEEDYYASQEKVKYQYSSNYYISYGSFNGSPNAGFAGKILERKVLKNEWTNQKFLWLKTESIVGIIDVVASLKFFAELPDVGDILTGEFYLSGKLTPHSKCIFAKLRKK